MEGTTTVLVTYIRGRGWRRDTMPLRSIPPYPKQPSGRASADWRMMWEQQTFVSCYDAAVR